MARRKRRGARGRYNKRLTPDEQAAEREAAFAAIRRLYCEVVPVWRFCERGFCRRHRQCIGDVGHCLARGWPSMPPALQQAAYDQVAAGDAHGMAPAPLSAVELRSLNACEKSLRHCEPARSEGEAIQPSRKFWIASSRSLSSGRPLRAGPVGSSQ